jgi:hypothetical protein
VDMHRNSRAPVQGDQNAMDKRDVTGGRDWYHNEPVWGPGGRGRIRNKGASVEIQLRLKYLRGCIPMRLCGTYV